MSQPAYGHLHLSKTSEASLKRKFSTKVRTPRKNLRYATQIVNSFINMGEKTVNSIQLQAAVEMLGWRHKWDLARAPMDDHGLRRALADLVGGHGLALPKIRSTSANVYQLPQQPIDDAYLTKLGYDPAVVRNQGVDVNLARAINDKLVLRFHYADDPMDAPVRIFHPHFYGMQGDNENIEGYQESGYSSRSEAPCWRNFHADKLLMPEVLQVHFEPQPHFDHKHPKYEHPYAVIITKNS